MLQFLRRLGRFLSRYGPRPSGNNKTRYRQSAIAAARFGAGLVASLIAGAATAAESESCRAAREAYDDLVANAVMEAAQYPLTAEGAAVRAACGRNALPVPAGSDVNPVRPHVHRKTMPGANLGTASGNGDSGLNRMGR